MANTEPTIIGRAESIHFPELEFKNIPARIDTGAKTSAIWASDMKVDKNELCFKLFGKESEFYTGKVIRAQQFSRKMIANSSGVMHDRYVVRLLVHFAGKKIRASFTLANRSTQVYPVLVGRNILRGKFLVDVKRGTVLTEKERARARELKLALEKLEEQI